jgi:hypothetical protein
MTKKIAKVVIAFIMIIGLSFSIANFIATDVDAGYIEYWGEHQDNGSCMYEYVNCKLIIWT